VILDIGRALDPVSVRALDMSDVIFPVMQLTLPSFVTRSVCWKCSLAGVFN